MERGADRPSVPKAQDFVQEEEGGGNVLFWKILVDMDGARRADEGEVDGTLFVFFIVAHEGKIGVKMAWIQLGGLVPVQQARTDFVEVCPGEQAFFIGEKRFADHSDGDGLPM